ncbi:monocarboxylate transporter 1-like isoform X3 [Conger conger]|uniref:monocarboxylate transporter 1-like isoform X3 n=1 Tax=Conger conger TaxID=82655 RepID=UPI002A598858|nr:monocarboxylate transporter 1-like isoform X3 [Conger conger]
MPAGTTTNLGDTPPDGGWGWAVVFGSFICIGFSYAFPKALTIYFKEIQEFFSISYSEIAWVSSIMLATMYAGGPVSSILVNRYGSRPVVIAGGLMCAAAMVTASFGTTIMHLYICIGIIGGMGLAFNLQPALTIIGKYFFIKRPIANGLTMAGSPVFLSTLAPLNQFLLDSFGWRGAFFILGAILLNGCVAGALMRPIGPQNPNPNRNGSSTAAMEDGKVSQDVGVLSGKALVDMFARPGTGLLANTRWIRPRIQYFFSLSVAYNGVCHLLCPLATGYVGLVIYAIFFGVAFGMVCALLFEVLMDMVGAQRFSSAVGLVTIIECGPVLLGPPIAGALVDIFMDYKYMYYACGAIMLAAGIFLFIMNFYNYRRLEQEEKEKLAAAVEFTADNEQSTLNTAVEATAGDEQSTLNTAVEVTADDEQSTLNTAEEKKSLEVPAQEKKDDPPCTFETES